MKMAFYFLLVAEPDRKLMLRGALSTFINSERLRCFFALSRFSTFSTRHPTSTHKRARILKTFLWYSVYVKASTKWENKTRSQSDEKHSRKSSPDILLIIFLVFYPFLRSSPTFLFSLSLVLENGKKNPFNNSQDVSYLFSIASYLLFLLLTLVASSSVFCPLFNWQ